MGFFFFFPRRRLFLVVVASLSLSLAVQTSQQASRRTFLESAASRATTLGLSSMLSAFPTLPSRAEVEEGSRLMMTPLDAAVELGALGTTRPYVVSASSSLVAIPARDAVASLTEAQTVWLGEHRGVFADEDREIQAGIIAAIAVAKAAQSSGRPPCVGVGLEAVRAEYQDALDSYVAGNLKDLRALEDAVEWNRHWPYALESYAPILDMCRELQLPLLALGASSPEIDVVETKGLAALDTDAWQRLSLPEGAPTLAFQGVPSSSMAANKEAATTQVASNSFQTTTEDPSSSPPSSSSSSSFANQYCGRLVWDESMAARAAAWVEARRDFDPTLVCLSGAEHVAFGCGAPARCARRLQAVNGRVPARSVLLNPRTDDFRLPSNGLGITFASTQKAPQKGEANKGDPNDLPIADFVWFSPWTDQFV